MSKKRKNVEELKLSDDTLDCLHADIEKINSLTHYDEKIKAQILLKEKIQMLLDIKVKLLNKMNSLEFIDHNDNTLTQKMSIDEIDNQVATIINSNDDIETKVTKYEKILLQLSMCKKELNKLSTMSVFQC